MVVMFFHTMIQSYTFIYYREDYYEQPIKYESGKRK